MNQGQQDALLKIRKFIWESDDKFLVLSGSPGTGKSYMIQKIVKDFEDQKEKVREKLKLLNMQNEVAAPIHIIKTASTGLAAINVGGSTLHSYLGIRPSTQGSWTVSQTMFNQAKARLGSAVIIVDEFTLLKQDIIDTLRLASSKDTKIIFVGDLFQLPPVKEQKSAVHSLSPQIVHLTETMRFQDQSGIGQLVAQIKDSIEHGNSITVSESDNLVLIDSPKVAREILTDPQIVPVAYTNDCVLKLADLNINAQTAHKSQGQTHKATLVVLDDFKRCRQQNLLKRLLYVGCSRPTEKLYLYGDLERTWFQILRT